MRGKGPAADSWQNTHGFVACGVLVPALGAAVIAVVALRRRGPVLTLLTVLLFGGTIGRWGSGRLISTLGQDGWTPVHVFFSSVVLALVVWAVVRTALLGRAAPPPW